MPKISCMRHSLMPVWKFKDRFSIFNARRLCDLVAEMHLIVFYDAKHDDENFFSYFSEIKICFIYILLIGN